MSLSIYGDQKDILPLVRNYIVNEIQKYNEIIIEENGHPVYEHLTSRVKSEDSMREKCRRKGLPETPDSALKQLTDAIGIRIITGYVEDIFVNIKHLRNLPGCQVIEEKDYVKKAKPNGYRSYHMILEYSPQKNHREGSDTDFYYVEVQLRTIAMDCWASLEHELKYKRTISNQQMLVDELKRCADELASCDVTMQTIRNLIREGERTC